MAIFPSLFLSYWQSAGMLEFPWMLLWSWSPRSYGSCGSSTLFFLPECSLPWPELHPAHPQICTSSSFLFWISDLYFPATLRHLYFMFCRNLSPNVSRATLIGVILLYLFFSLVWCSVYHHVRHPSEHTPLCSHFYFLGLFLDLLTSLPPTSFSFMQLVAIIYWTVTLCQELFSGLSIHKLS